MKIIMAAVMISSATRERDWVAEVDRARGSLSWLSNMMEISVRSFFFFLSFVRSFFLFSLTGRKIREEFSPPPDRVWTLLSDPEREMRSPRLIHGI